MSRSNDLAFKDHFSARSADYALYRPAYPPALAAYLARQAPGRRAALDGACGTGQLSTVLAAAFEQVFAIDASARQIAHATPHPRVDYRVARCEETGMAGASLDLLTVAQAAHWLDLDPFYAEARRVLRPGGVLALITYGATKLEGEAGHVLDRFYAETLGPFWPPERRHVETGYRLLPFPFEEESAPELAIEARWPLAALLGYVDTWSAVRNLERAFGREPYERFAADLSAAWGDPRRTMALRWPLSLRVGRV